MHCSDHRPVFWGRPGRWSPPEPRATGPGTTRPEVTGKGDAARAGQAPLLALPVSRRAPSGSRCPPLRCSSLTCQTGGGCCSRERGWASACARVRTRVPYLPAPRALDSLVAALPHCPPATPALQGPQSAPPPGLLVTVGQAAALLVCFPNSIWHGPRRKQMAHTGHFLEGLWQRDCWQAREQGQRAHKGGGTPETETIPGRRALSGAEPDLISWVQTRPPPRTGRLVSPTRGTAADLGAG